MESSLKDYQVTTEATVECHFCGKANVQSSRQCKECESPNDISQLVADGKTVKIITTLGAPSVGKSTYLGTLLDVLERQRTGPEISLAGDNSPELQKTVMSMLARGAFPPKNSLDKLIWNQCQVRKSRKETELFLADFSGISAIEDYEDRRAWPTIPATIGVSKGVMLFIDAGAVHQGAEDEEYFALHLLQYYWEVRRRLRDEQGLSKDAKDRTPFAIVLTKSEQSNDCMQRTESFVEKTLPELSQACKKNLPNHKFFAVSTVGACATVISRGYRTEIPLRVEPRGIVEPFQWLFEQI